MFHNYFIRTEDCTSSFKKLSDGRWNPYFDETNAHLTPVNTHEIGLVINRIKAESVAEKAGLMEGDIIVHIDVLRGNCEKVHDEAVLGSIDFSCGISVESRLKIVKKSHTKARLFVKRSTSKVFQSTKHWIRKAIENCPIAYESQFPPRDLWYCHDCHKSSDEGKIKLSVVEEAKSCQTVLRQIMVILSSLR